MISIIDLFESKVDLQCNTCNKNITNNSELGYRPEFDEKIHNVDINKQIPFHLNCGGSVRSSINKK